MKERLVLELKDYLYLGRFAILVAALQTVHNPLFSEQLQREIKSWAVYYSDQAPLPVLEQYDLLVLDSLHHPKLEPLADRKILLLGYISLGEVAQHRSYFQEVQSEGILLKENPHWKGSYFVDIRDKRWTRRVLEELVPEILRQGFHGLFIDTLDNPPHLEREYPEEFSGMTDAATQLVRSIRYHYPKTKIMLNRGYELLPRLENEIDMVLGESVFADYNFDKESYGRVEQSLYRNQISILSASLKRRPELRVMTLDYWDPTDQKGITEIYEEQRRNGFLPYVATIELDRIVPEPKR